MAGTGGAYVLSKGFGVLSTYNTSNANGVEAFRIVQLATTGLIDISANATGVPLGVVMENIDRAKVATGKAVANVQMSGIVPVKVQTATSIVIGSRVMSGSAGGVIIAATAASFILGTVVGFTGPGALADGDIVEVLLAGTATKFVS